MLRSSFCCMLFSVISGRSSTCAGVSHDPSASCSATRACRSAHHPVVPQELGTPTRGPGVSTVSHGTLRAARSSPSLGSTTTSSVGALGDAEPASAEPDQRLRLRLAQLEPLHHRELARRRPWPPRRAQRAAPHLPWASPCRTCAGVGPNGLPPPFHWVARIEPCRARPVPFCFQGFLPPPDTSLRPLVSWVPARRAASSRTTAWWSSGTRGSARRRRRRRARACRAPCPLASTTWTRSAWPLWSRSRLLWPAAPWSASRSCGSRRARRSRRAPRRAAGSGSARGARAPPRGWARYARSPPMRPGSWWPGHTREGSDDAPIEPGRPVEHRAVGGVAAATSRGA